MALSSHKPCPAVYTVMTATTGSFRTIIQSVRPTTPQYGFVKSTPATACPHALKISLNQPPASTAAASPPRLAPSSVNYCNHAPRFKHQQSVRTSYSQLMRTRVPRHRRRLNLQSRRLSRYTANVPVHRLQLHRGYLILTTGAVFSPPPPLRPPTPDSAKAHHGRNARTHVATAAHSQDRYRIHPRPPLCRPRQDRVSSKLRHIYESRLRPLNNPLLDVYKYDTTPRA
ncbi:hypothetical protein K438DRAFT_2022917 [Mycena galopus ATCC 62051]|nr:hypothetical protein K438DRAFT_2022917 [Mycena galopus ATCC 62051]